MKTGCNTFLLDKVKSSLLSLNNNVLIKQEYGKQVVSLLRPTENESFFFFFFPSPFGRICFQADKSSEVSRYMAQIQVTYVEERLAVHGLGWKEERML